MLDGEHRESRRKTVRESDHRDRPFHVGKVRRVAVRAAREKDCPVHLVDDDRPELRRRARLLVRLLALDRIVGDERELLRLVRLFDDGPEVVRAAHDMPLAHPVVIRAAREASRRDLAHDIRLPALRMSDGRDAVIQVESNLGRREPIRFDEGVRRVSNTLHSA